MSCRVETWRLLRLIFSFMLSRYSSSSSISSSLWSGLIASWTSSPDSSSNSSARLMPTDGKRSSIAMLSSVLSFAWMCSMVDLRQSHFFSSITRLIDPHSFLSSLVSASNYASMEVADSFDVTTRQVGTWLRRFETPRICKPSWPCSMPFVMWSIDFSGCKN